MRPTDAAADVRANPFPWITEDHVERRIDHEHVRASRFMMTSIRDVGKRQSRAMNVGVHLEADYSIQSGWKDSDLEPRSQTVMN